MFSTNQTNYTNGVKAAMKTAIEAQQNFLKELDRVPELTLQYGKEKPFLENCTGTQDNSPFAEVLSVDELAKLWDICKPKAYALAREKDFPSFKIGKRIFINKRKLQTWMDAQ